MKATLLATATKRSALIERMQNVASTRPAAAKPTPSMADRSLIRFYFLLKAARRIGAGFTLPHQWRSAQSVSAVAARALGLARQFGRTGAARLAAPRPRRGAAP